MLQVKGCGPIRFMSSGFLFLMAYSTKATDPATYTVSYHLAGSASITFDSVKYEDAQGGLVRVVAPARDGSVTCSMNSGGYIQGSAWGHALAGAQTANLKVTWTRSGVSTASDSSGAAISAPGAFALAILRRQI